VWVELVKCFNYGMYIKYTLSTSIILSLSTERVSNCIGNMTDKVIIILVLGRETGDHCIRHGYAVEQKSVQL